MCDMFYYVDNVKAMVNEDARQDRELLVKLRGLVVKTHSGCFWNIFSPYFMHAALIMLCVLDVYLYNAYFSEPWSTSHVVDM